MTRDTRLPAVGLLVAVFLCWTGAVRQGLAEEPLNLLFFGNSYTIRNDLTDAVKRLAVADGHPEPVVVADLFGGQDLGYHLAEVNNNPQNSIAKPGFDAGNPFDFVVMQGHSQEATHLRAPVSNFINNAVSLADAVRSAPAGADAEIVLYQTWARAQGHSFYPSSFSDPFAMMSEIRGNYLLARDAINADAGAAIAAIAPVGDAFELHGFSPSFYESDLHHPNQGGTSLAAMILYRTIYDEDVSDIPYSSVSSWVGVAPFSWSAVTGLADQVQVGQVPTPNAAALLATIILPLATKRQRFE